MAGSILSLKIFAGLIAAYHATCALAAPPPTLDYVVVGGGPAGLVVAERLSRNPRVRITLLEAGSEVSGIPSVTTPGRLTEVGNPGVDRLWDYYSQPDPNLGGRAPDLWQGRAIGGASAVNSMTYCRGSASVFDEWADISGNSGLAWSSLVDDFRSTAHYTHQPANYQQTVNRRFYGNGPLEVSRTRNLTGLEIPVAREFQSRLRIPEIDMTDGRGIGVSLGLTTIRVSNRTRSYAGNTYYFLLAGRPNVQVLPNSWVQRINFSGTRATGVTYINNQTAAVTTLTAKEVIVAAGALNSPKLLLQSGIGPRGDLTRLNIPVVANVPGVGATLLDHHSSYVQAEVTGDIHTVWQLITNATYAAEAAAQYQSSASGPLSGPHGVTYAGARLPDSVFAGVEGGEYYTGLPADRPHLLWHYVASAFSPDSANVSTVSLAPTLVQPAYHGRLTINSTDYRAPPIFYSNFYGTAADRAAMIYGMRQARNVFSAASLSSFVVAESYPGPDVTSDDDALWAAIQAGSRSFHHPVGTVPLGTVLSANWRVRGVQGLRVVDSSAMPTLPTCYIMASVYAMANRAASDIIRDDRV